MVVIYFGELLVTTDLDKESEYGVDLMNVRFTRQLGDEKAISMLEPLGLNLNFSQSCDQNSSELSRSKIDAKVTGLSASLSRSDIVIISQLSSALSGLALDGESPETEVTVQPSLAGFKRKLEFKMASLTFSILLPRAESMKQNLRDKGT